MLFIGIPTYGLITYETFLSVISYLGTGPGPVQISCGVGCYVHRNRNGLVKKMLATDATHILFLDSDICFPPTAIAQLLSHDVMVVGGAYRSRDGLQITVKQFTDTGIENLAEVPNEVFRCASVPTGFLLIRRDVFDILPFPWFSMALDENGEDVGEDTNFCLNCNDAGITVWCDGTLRLGHVGKAIY